MIIREGYSSKPTAIKISVGENKRIDLWIENEGFDRSETVHYVTVTELMALRDECNKALKEAVGL